MRVGVGMESSVERLPRVTALSDRLELAWPNGQRSQHLYYWLRENCSCRQCRHADAWERIADFLAIPLDIKPAAVCADEGGLHLTWPTHDAPCEGTHYGWPWLDDHRAETEARLARKHRARAWSLPVPTKPELSVPFARVMASDSGLERLLTHVDAKGVGFVTGVPDDELAATRLAERIAFVEESHFGRDFDVVSKVRPENLAFTSGPLYPHNDLSSREHLPGVQLLHCLRNSAKGGESVLVDGVGAAERLRAQDEEAFRLLSTCKVTFSSEAQDWQIANRTTVLEVDEDGDIVGTRLHPALLGPVDIEPDEQASFYRAHRALLAITLDPDLRFTFRMAEGECVIFDNVRILHARTAFDSASGDRHLKGCYVCRDDLRSRLHVLQRGTADHRLR